MTSTQIKKPRKTCQEANDDKDFISKLPERIITNILSRLLTKTAVKTSVLSKNWEYKWTFIYKLNIIDRSRYEHRRKKSSFVNFVDRVLFLSRELKSFRLTCREKYDSSRLTGWISAVLKRDIERFELEADNPKGLVLPRSLVNKTSLRKLKLAISCTFKVPLVNNFPNLTSLYLQEVEIMNMLYDSDPLVFTFPVLKTFELQKCKWSNVNLVEIHSPKLTKFKCVTVEGVGVNNYSIKICGARIEKFESSGGFPEETLFYESLVRKATFGNAFKLSECESEVDEDVSCLLSGLQVRKLLKEFPSVTKLQLSDSMCEAITLSKQKLPLPQYDRLQRLVMSIWRDTKLLFEFLHSAPSLRFLQIDGYRVEEFDCDEVDSVPSCVTSHLEEVKFVNTPEKTLIHLAKFFLKNGVKLKKVCPGVTYWTEVDSIVDQLLMLPRASASLAIVDEY